MEDVETNEIFGDGRGGGGGARCEKKNQVLDESGFVSILTAFHFRSEFFLTIF